MTNTLALTNTPSLSLPPTLRNPMDPSNPYSQESPQAIAYTRGRIARANGAEKVVPSGLLYQQAQAWREGYQREAGAQALTMGHASLGQYCYVATGLTIATELARFPKRLTKTASQVLASSQGRISK